MSSVDKNMEQTELPYTVVKAQIGAITLGNWSSL